MRQLLTASLHIELRPAQIGDVGAGYDGAAFRTVERNDDDRPPARLPAGLGRVLGAEAVSQSAKHCQDARVELDGALVRVRHRRAVGFEKVLTDARR